MIRFHLGDLQVSILDGGTLWLDGGAMFGVVPRVLWERLHLPDDKNRIQLAMNVLLVEDGKRRILVDTGAGTKWDERAREMYRLAPRPAAELLEPAGLTPGDIDLVVSTHLHFDHAGGNTERAADGGLRAAFPNAEYVVQRGELETARWQNERTRASYLAENFEPLASERRLRLVEGDVALDRHMHLRFAPGHTPSMQVPLILTRERTLAFLGDLVPTASHVPFAYIMAYDLEPLATLATKKRLLPEAARSGWYLVFEHDAYLPLGSLKEHAGRLRAEPVQVEA